MAKSKTRNIPRKNYVIVLCIILAVVLITLYIFQWYKVSKEGKMASSYLIHSKTIAYEMKDLNEISSVFLEAPEEYFVYISYVNSEEVYHLEKDLKSIIDEYHLKDNFYYLNVTSYMKEENYLDKINDAFGFQEQKIQKLPTILYFKNGSLAKDGIVKREDNHIIEAQDFRQLLDVQEITKDSH